MNFEKTQEQLDTLRNLTWQNGKLIEQNQQLLDQLENGAGAIGSEIMVGKQALVDAIEYKGGESSADKSLQGIAEDIKEIPNFDQWARLAGVLAGSSVGKDSLQGHNENVAAGGITKLTDYLGTFTRLNSNAFQYWDLLEEVELPNLATIASNNIFYNCPSLQSVEFKNLTTISGHDNFRGCTSLQSVEIPNLATISGSGTFHSCSSLQSVQFPNLITISNNNQTFTNCPSLQSVELGILVQCYDLFYRAIQNLRNITIGVGTDINLPFQNWTATNVIAEGQSGIDELNSNLYNNLLTKLYDHSTDGQTRTLRLGWLAHVTQENIDYANSKGWTLTT